jgi:hypothetical protein
MPRVPLLVGHLENVESRHRAGNVDLRVNAAKAVYRRLDDRLGRRRRHQVEFDYQRRGADRFDLLGDLSQLFPVTATRTTASKSCASRSAADLPIPELAPVTIATDLNIVSLRMALVGGRLGSARSLEGAGV